MHAPSENLPSSCQDAPPIRVGAQLFINRHDSPGEVDRQLRRMHEAGLTLVRIFALWDHLEPAEGQWKWDVYDQVFETAAACRIGVVVTLMAVSPPGWMRCTHGMQDVGDLDDPLLWSQSLAYVRRVVARWHAKPALDSWILWNEPSRRLARIPSVLTLFREFLTTKYEGEIIRLNRVYFRQYARFSEILTEPDSAAYDVGFTSRAEEVDWIEFTVANLTEKLADLAGAVRAADGNHPIHVNPHRMAHCMLESGQSLWREAEVVDFMGFSAHPPWHSTRFPEDRVQQSIGLFADLARSTTLHKDGRFWCTELQGGPTVLTAFRPSTPSAGEISRWMWECAGSGAEAVIFWCFNAREDGYEAGEWSLCRADGSPSPRLNAASRVAAEFAACADWFAGARAQPEILILHSDTSQALGLVEGEGEDPRNPRNRQMGADAACGAYLMSSDLGWESAFVDERRIQERRLPASAKVLIAPGIITLEDATLTAIEEWVKRGGTFLADGLFCWKTPAGALARSQAPQLAHLLGAKVIDFTAQEEPAFSDRTDQLARGWLFRTELAAAGDAEIFAFWTDGSPAVVGKTHQRGRAIRIGTTFFQRYLPHPEEASLRALRHLLAVGAPEPLRLVNPPPGLRLRRLHSSSGVVGILLGTKAGERAEVCFSAAGRWQLPDRTWHPVSKGGSAMVTLDDHGTARLRFEYAASFSAPPETRRKLAPADSIG